MEKKRLSKLEVDCNSIRENIKECGQLYILVAYKVYELYFYETYKEKYKSIVSCCEAEFGFKKATTYNLIGIVEKFGERDLSGMITYKSITRYNKFSYSQLAEMLSLSVSQRESITPDTTISEIRNIKKLKITNNEKVQTSGKINNSDIIETPEIENTVENSVIDVQPEQLKPVETNSSDEVSELKYKLQISEERADCHWKAREEQADTIHKYIEKNRELQEEVKELRKEINDLIEEKEKLHREYENRFRSILEQRDAFREQVLELKKRIEQLES